MRVSLRRRRAKGTTRYATSNDRNADERYGTVAGLTAALAGCSFPGSGGEEGGGESGGEEGGEEGGGESGGEEGGEEGGGESGGEEGGEEGEEGGDRAAPAGRTDA